MRSICAFLCLCVSSSTALAQSSPEQLLSAYDVTETSRRIVGQGWFVDFYEHVDQNVHTENILVRQGALACLVPDYSYLDGMGLPRETALLPTYGAGGTIVGKAAVADGTEISWHEAAAWHGDYGTPERTGSYVLNQQGLVIRATLGAYTLSYSYDLPEEPQGTVPSCYDLRLPKPPGGE